MDLGEPIAPLRADLELQSRANGTVDVRDPFRLQIFTLDSDEVHVARAFDGTRDARAVSQALKANGGPKPTPRRVVEIAQTLREIDLLDLPEVWEKAPVVENATPYTIVESTSKRLKVLPEPEPGARWSCGACGVCCHGLAVEVTPEEEARIDPSLYPDMLHDGPCVEDAFIDPDRPATRVLRQRPEDGGACVFLMPNGLCAVHARQGMEAKPDACQIFPNMVIHLPNGKARLAMRTNCRTMHESFETGQPVEEHRGHVLRILETSAAYKLPRVMDVFGVPTPFKAVDALRARINAVFEAEGVTPDALARLDAELLGGRVGAARKAYGRNILAYIKEEQEGDVTVEVGALAHYIDISKKGREALDAMRRGRRAPVVGEKVQAFLRAQVRNVLFAAGPMTFPDAGLGHAALLLAVEATLHAVGPRGRLKGANDAFIAFTMPIIETTAHAWPILDALDPVYAQKLRKEL